MSLYRTSAQRIHTKAQSGFTLVELMVVITVMGIMATLAAPSINNALERQRNQETAQKIVVALKEARTESLLRRQDVTVDVASDNISLSVRNTGAAQATIIKNFALSSKSPVTPSATSVVFRANKTVSAARTFTVACDAEGTKDGRVVTLDVNGNVAINTGASQC